MRIYTIPANTQCRLVKVKDGSELPFKPTKNLVLNSNDVVIDPALVYRTHSRTISEYGFENGTKEQREKYVLMVPSKHVQMTEEEE